MKPKISFFVVVSLFAIALSTCGESVHSKYGTKYNPEREKLGIPTLPSNWIADSRYAGDWYDPDAIIKKAAAFLCMLRNRLIFEMVY
jgi:hypothetical protein